MITTENKPQYLRVRHIPWFSGAAFIVCTYFISLLALKIITTGDGLLETIVIGFMLSGFLIGTFFTLRISEMRFDRIAGKAEILVISLLGPKRIIFPLAYVRNVHVRKRHRLGSSKRFQVMFAIYDGAESYDVPVEAMEGTSRKFVRAAKLARHWLKTKP